MSEIFQLTDAYDITGRYGLLQHLVIVRDLQGSYLLLAEGYGGEGSVRGGNYRFEHGVCARLKPGDTLQLLLDTKWNATTSLLDAILKDLDQDRPLSSASGIVISRIYHIAFSGMPAIGYVSQKEIDEAGITDTNYQIGWYYSWTGSVSSVVDVFLSTYSAKYGPVRDHVIGPFETETEARADIAAGIADIAAGIAEQEEG